MGIPVTPFTPRGADKFTRMHACAPVFEWYGGHQIRFVSDEVMEECAAFPNGEHDDLADSMTQAILRFRQGGFINHSSDYDDEDELAYARRKKGILLMAKKRKKAKLTPTRSGAQIYMSDSYAKEFLDSIDNREPTDLEKLMDKKR